MAGQSYVDKKGLTVKELVSIGVFTALFVVFAMIGGTPFSPNPVLTFYTPLGMSLLCGPMFLLMVAKAPKRWSITILAVIVAVLWYVTGMHWAQAVGSLVLGIIADFVAGTKQYKSKKINVLAYMIYCLHFTGSYVVYFIDPAGWAATILAKGTSQDYVDTMAASYTGWMPFVVIIGTLVLAAFSGWVGCKLLKKQFEKAGIAA